MSKQMNERELNRKLTNAEYYQRVKADQKQPITCACGATHQKRYTSIHIKKKSHNIGLLRKYFNALKDEEHILLSPPSVAKQLAQAHQVIQKKWMDGINRMLKASPLLNESNIKTSYKL